MKTIYTLTRGGRHVENMSYLSQIAWANIYMGLFIIFYHINARDGTGCVCGCGDESDEGYYILHSFVVRDRENDCFVWRNLAKKQCSI